MKIAEIFSNAGYSRGDDWDYDWDDRRHDHNYRWHNKHHWRNKKHHWYRRWDDDC